VGATDRSASADEAQPPRSTGFIEIFLVFSQLGLLSFGGGLPAWMRQAFVERRRSLSETEFSAALALARIMPGVNVVNLAVLIGQRLRGFLGAAAAVMGLLVGPSLTVISLAILYRQFAGTIIIEHVLEGAAASAVGLLIGMGVVSGKRIIGASVTSTGLTAQSVGAIVILATMFVLVGVLRFPTVATVLCLAPFSIALAFFTAQRESRDQRDDGR
jgi:chromate transporter